MTTASADPVTGRCGRVQDGRLNVRAVRARQTGGHAVRGALTGAGAMALVGDLPRERLLRTSNWRRDYTAPIVASSLAGGVGGLIVGVIAGYGDVKWKRRYP